MDVEGAAVRQRKSPDHVLLSVRRTGSLGPKLRVTQHSKPRKDERMPMVCELGAGGVQGELAKAPGMPRVT